MATGPAIRARVETATVGDQTIVTVDGAVHLTLTSAEAAVLAGVDGSSSLDELADAHPGVDVVGLLDDLDTAGFLEGSARFVEPAVVWTRSGVEFDGFGRFVTAVHRIGGRYLLGPLVAPVTIVAALVGSVAALRAPTAPVDTTGPAALVALVALGWLATVAHETGHGLVIHHHRRRVGRAGLGLYWGAPSFYVDATDAWFLPRRYRMAQTAAGPVADLAVIATSGVAAWLLAPSPAATVLAAFVVLSWIDVAVNLAPLLKLDGYWLLADALDRPGLAEEAHSALRGRLHTEPAPIRRRLAAYAAVSCSFGAVLVVAGAWAWITHLGPLVTDAWHQGLLGKTAAVAFTAPTATALATPVIHTIRRRTNRTSSTEE